MARAKKQVEVIEAAPNISMRGNEVKSIRRVAAYCRVSSDHIEQKTSYDAQIDEYTNRIQNNPKWEFAGIYADEAKSGTSTHMHLLMSLLQVLLTYQQMLPLMELVQEITHLHLKKQ